MGSAIASIRSSAIAGSPRRAALNIGELRNALGASVSDSLAVGAIVAPDPAFARPGSLITTVGNEVYPVPRLPTFTLVIAPVFTKGVGGYCEKRMYVVPTSVST